MTAACASAAWAAGPATITTLHNIRTLTKAEARNGLPVAFEATVTYYNRSDIDLFVQDGEEAIYVETKANEDLAPGDRVLVRGKTRDSFTQDVLSDSVTVLRHGALPTPVAADFQQLIPVGVRSSMEHSSEIARRTSRPSALFKSRSRPVTVRRSERCMRHSIPSPNNTPASPRLSRQRRP